MKNLLLAVSVGIVFFSCTPRAVNDQNARDLPEGYVLHFSESFKPGMSVVDDLGIALVFGIDVSGSMADAPRTGGDAKYLQATRALTTIVKYLKGLLSREKDLVIKVAILKFSTSVKTVLPLTTLDVAGIRDLDEVVANPTNFTPDARTAIGKVIEKGSEILAGAGTIMKSLIVITDGENNELPDPKNVIEAVYANRNSASTPEIPVSTSTQLLSFIGFDIESGVFDGYKNQGARVNVAGDQNELELSLKSLLEADITKLESK